MSEDAGNDPELEGYEARLAGTKSETDNPYPFDSDEHLSWNDGYERACEEMDV